MLAGIVFGFAYNAKKLKVLILTGPGENTANIANALSETLKTDGARNAVHQKLKEISPQMKENNNWSIDQCCVKDSKADRLIKKSQVIIVLSDNQTSIEKINKKLLTTARDKFFISCVPNGPNANHFNYPWTFCEVIIGPRSTRRYRMFDGYQIKYCINTDGSLKIESEIC